MDSSPAQVTLCESLKIWRLRWSLNIDSSDERRSKSSGARSLSPCHHTEKFRLGITQVYQEPSTQTFAFSRGSLWLCPLAIRKAISPSISNGLCLLLVHRHC